MYSYLPKTMFPLSFQGLTWPAMYAAVGHWIPLSERSKFMSSFQGIYNSVNILYFYVTIRRFYYKFIKNYDEFSHCH